MLKSLDKKNKQKIVELDQTYSMFAPIKSKKTCIYKYRYYYLSLVVILLSDQPSNGIIHVFLYLYHSTV